MVSRLKIWIIHMHLKVVSILNRIIMMLFGPYVFCAFSNGKEFNPKKLFKALYDKALNEYYVQHNCSVDIMLEEKSELDRLNELLEELKKKEQVDYFVE